MQTSTTQNIVFRPGDVLVDTSTVSGAAQTINRRNSFFYFEHRCGLIQGEYPFMEGNNMLKLYLDSRMFGGKPRYYLARRREEEMVIPELIRRCVAFLCYRNKSGKICFAGTCFFLGFAPEGHAVDGTEGFFRYMITAKHVIVGIKNKSVDGKAIMRLNRKNGGADYYDTDVNDWFTNPDAPSDVAILEWCPEPNEFDVGVIMNDMFQKENVNPREKIWVGDDVFIVGLFKNHAGKKRNAPIVRAGNIAMLADENEKISTRYFGDMEAHLIECRSIGGLSGSPVFVHITGPRIDDAGKALLVQMRYIYLFGLIHGHYDVQLPGEDQAVEDEENESAVNMGIAIVVPAQKILEVLMHPKLVKSREDELRTIQEKVLPVEDSTSKDFTKEEFEETLKKISRPLKPDEKGKGKK